MKIRLKTIDSVKDFVSAMSKLESEIDLISGRYIINAKSIMGIFSLDLTKDIEVKISEIDKEELEKFNNLIKPYLI